MKHVTRTGRHAARHRQVGVVVAMPIKASMKAYNACPFDTLKFA